MKTQLILGDSLEKLKDLEPNSIDTIITDPPYGLSFMGKKWDYDVPSVELWKECLRVLKPGGTALIFAGSRTQHRMAVNVEDAGFELKDCIMWLYGSGFPKATDISKQLDKVAGAKRNRIEVQEAAKDSVDYGKYSGEIDDNNAITEEAKLWNGWKSHGLKPAYEPILVAMKPNEGTYANNALKWGVSGLNIEQARIPTEEDLNGGAYSKGEYDTSGKTYELGLKRQEGKYEQPQGRFPANIILDEEAGKMLDEQSGVSKSVRNNRGVGIGDGYCGATTGQTNIGGHNDKGGASRFFYCAKASKAERNKGCEDLEKGIGVGNYMAEAKWIKDDRHKDGGYAAAPSKPQSNSHPTVKPLKLMEYLCTLTKTPTGGIVLDPFMGSGTTGVACKNTGRDFIGIEREEEYIKIAKARINVVQDNENSGS